MRSDVRMLLERVRPRFIKGLRRVAVLIIVIAAVGVGYLGYRDQENRKINSNRSSARPAPEHNDTITSNEFDNPGAKLIPKTLPDPEARPKYNWLAPWQRREVETKL